MAETGKPVDGVLESYHADGSSFKHPVIAGRVIAPPVDPEVKAILDAVIDYNFDQVLHKMEVHKVDFDMALQMQLAVIMAGAE